MNFKDYQQKQMFLFPPSILDYLGESHQAVILNEFLASSDFTSLEQSYNNQAGGSSAFHPIMLLGILIYGYMNGIFSSRQLAKQLRQNLAFIYLSGNTTPDFRTLSRFRKDKGMYLEQIFSSVVRKAQELGLVNFGTCCLDGTKIYASASTSRNHIKKVVKEKIRALIAEAEKVDQMEDEIFGDQEDDENAELKTKEGREKRKQELEERRKKEENRLEKLEVLSSKNEEARVNFTDPDSKLMKMKKKDFANGYNVQIISENGIILCNDISNSSSDQKTLIPALEKLSGSLVKPKILLADKGYSSEENYSFCENNGINAYIPPNKEPINLSNYNYDKIVDTYTDQGGRIFYFKQHSKRRGEKKRYKHSQSPSLRHNDYRRTIYEYINSETKEKKYLCISPGWQEYAKKQKEKLRTAKGKEIYKQRMHDVEGVFANIKKNLKFTSFNLRGFTGVNTEWTLIALAHNLKKVL